MRKKNYLILFILIWLSVTSTCLGGKYAADFLSIAPGARALGLGKAAVALTDDATGIYWNPATLFRVKGYSLSLMHAERFSSLEKYNFVGLVAEVKSLGHLGVSWIRLGIDDIPIYGELSGSHTDRLGNPDLQPSSKGKGEYEEPEGYLQDVENAIFFSYSRASPKPLSIGDIPVAISWGANVKYIFTHLGSARSNGIGFDLATLLSATLESGKLSVGIVAQNAFAISLKWNTNHEDIIPVNFKIGSIYTPAEGVFSDFTLAFALDTRYRFAPHIGLEYRPFDLLALRVGLYQPGYTMGAGLKIKRFIVDYAFTGEDLANSHHVSLNANF